MRQRRRVRFTLMLSPEGVPASGGEPYPSGMRITEENCTVKKSRARTLEFRTQVCVDWTPPHAKAGQTHAMTRRMGGSDYSMNQRLRVELGSLPGVLTERITQSSVIGPFPQWLAKNAKGTVWISSKLHDVQAVRHRYLEITIRVSDCQLALTEHCDPCSVSHDCQHVRHGHAFVEVHVTNIRRQGAFPVGWGNGCGRGRGVLGIR